MTKHIERSFKVNGLSVNIVHDDDAESPRQWDNMGTLVILDENLGLPCDGNHNKHDFKSIAALMAHLQVNQSVWLPVFFRDGYTKSIETNVAEMVRQKIAYSNLPEDAESDAIEELWPRGQCGVIFIDSDKVAHEYGDDTPENRAKALECLKGEIDTYNQWLAGDIWGYEIERIEVCKSCECSKNTFVDSCWGFYGLEYAIEEAKQSAKAVG
jgi:hypothetical protein